MSGPMKLDTSNIRDVLKTRLPALADSHPERSDVWSESPAHNYALFGEVLRPFMFSLLRSPGHEHELRQLFSLLEEIARGDSPTLSDILQVEIVIPLANTKADRELAWKYLGGSLRKLVNEAGKWNFRVWLGNLLTR